jgi:hypothetical protein
MESITRSRDSGVRRQAASLLVGVLLGITTTAAASDVGLITSREDGRLLVAGAIVVDRAARSVTVPAVVNQHRGLVEYLLVHSSGKRHEALFVTSVQPQHLHLACLLVGAPDSAEPTTTSTTVTVTVEWQGHGPVVRQVADQLLLPATHDGEPLSVPQAVSAGWHYGGSQFVREGFAAQVSGSCIALQADPAALLSAPGLLAYEFVPAASRLPAIATPVAIVLTFPAALPAVALPTMPEPKDPS